MVFLLRVRLWPVDINFLLMVYRLYEIEIIYWGKRGVALWGVVVTAITIPGNIQGSFG